MSKNEIRLIEYTKKQDLANSITHGTGAVMAVICFALMMRKAAGSEPIELASVIIHGLALIAVYTISTVYHALPQGEAKRRARLFDHLAIPILMAGTSTPCALIPLARESKASGIAVFCIAWFIAAFGVISKTFFFEKMRAVVMAVYFVGGAVMFALAIPYAGCFDRLAFSLLFVGAGFYTIGAILCHAGIKKPCLHAVFHAFALAGSLTQWYVIYAYIV